MRPTATIAHDAAFVGAFLPDSGEAGFAERRVRASADALGLAARIRELDEQGYTVLSPGEIAAGDLAIRLRDALVDIAERRSGARPDLAGDGEGHGVTAVGRGQFLHHVLFKDPVFEEALMQPAALAVITHLLGENCVLSSMNAMIKSAGGPNLEFHTDQVGTPAPFPPYAQVANATWALTDYSREAGSISFVPGSHRLCRHPTPVEATDVTLGVPVEAEAGSLIVWHGNTWHGAYARRIGGLRVNLMMFFCRWYLLPQAMYRSRATPEMIARNGPRFSTLMGRRNPYAGADLDGETPSMALGQASWYD